MNQTGLIGALALLLRDSGWRQRFRQGPEEVCSELGLQGNDRSSLLALTPADLEFQAAILLRKRFQSISSWVPRTVQSLGSEAYPCFESYASESWPQRPTSLDPSDAIGFLVYLETKQARDIHKRELNRLRFLNSSFPIRISRMRPRLFAFQILIRAPSRRVHEFVLSLENPVG